MFSIWKLGKILLAHSVELKNVNKKGSLKNFIQLEKLRDL